MVSVCIAGRWIAGIVLAGMLLFSARFATSFPTRISVLPNLQVDASTYDTIAWSLSKTWSVESIPPLQPPGFVVFLGIVYRLFGHSWVAGRLALWVCLVIATGLSAFVARRIHQREEPAWIAALLCASSPALIAYAGTLQYELLASSLLLGLLWGAVRVGSSVPAKISASRLVNAAALGFGIGLAVLTREVLVVLAPIVSIYLFLRVSSIESKQKAALISALCLICASIPPLAWSTVQSTRTDRVVTVSDKGPLVMAFGNNPAANGTFNTPLVGMPEPSGWAFITANPRAAAWLWMRKAGYFWGLLRDGWNVPRPAGTFVANATAGTVPLQWILPWARGGWLLIAFVISLSLWRRETWAAWWLLPAAVAAVMAIHVVTISSYRFAVPVLPLVMAVIAGPVARSFTAVWRSTRARVAAVLLLLLAVAAQIVSWPLVYELDATTFDGFSAENRIDEETGERVRFVDAARGRRLALVLADEYFPSGTLAVRMSVRADGTTTDRQQLLFRMALSSIDGATVCEHIVTREQVGDRQATIELPCQLAKAGPSTFLVEALGTADLRFGPVRFAWNAPQIP